MKLWSSIDTLDWNDFKGLDDGSNFAALIHWEINYNVIDSSRLEIYACINRRKSWWRIPGSHLLRHEQYHFNIAEIFARLIRKSVIEKGLRPNSVDFDNNFNSLIEECKIMEKQYDLTTEHSKNSEAQITWEIYIDKQLKKFEKYTSAIVSQ